LLLTKTTALHALQIEGLKIKEDVHGVNCKQAAYKFDNYFAIFWAVYLSFTP
jgi:hypothetical protein